MKRVILFILTNLAVMLVLSIVFNLLAVSGVLGPYGNPGTLGGLLVFAAIFGMGGAFISLALSKWMARMATGAQIIGAPRNPDEVWLKSTVERLARQAGIGIPDVAIYDSPQPNAFATGMSRDHAMVAVSSGLLQTMDRSQVEAVLGHEITHVSNGDMVTMALLQGVLNTFVIALSRIVANVVGNAVARDDREGRGLSELAYFATVLVTQILFGILASLIVFAFSRWREFRADAGGAKLAGRNKMISALQRLQTVAEQPADLPKQMQAFGIADGGGLTRLFMSHPPIAERIAALQKLQQIL
ncbi:MAG TPA: protease HtpX [Gammaproteobacteria bacterium]|nr:protease HtpX [Gammaproteobacteria bacterium]